MVQQTSGVVPDTKRMCCVVDYLEVVVVGDLLYGIDIARMTVYMNRQNGCG